MSGLQRRTPLTRPSALRRGPWRTDGPGRRATPIGRKVRIAKRNAKRGGSLFRHRRCKPFCEHIRTLPCLLAGDPRHDCTGRSEPSHVGAQGSGHNDIGEIVPLCGIGHRLSPLSWHRLGRHSFPAYWGFGTLDAMETMARKLGREWVEANPEIASKYLYDVGEAA